LVSVPSPICPKAFQPQQYSDLPVLTAQVWAPPAATLAQAPLDPIRLGESRCSTVPSPTWPLVFPPQQYSDLLALIAHVWNSPAETTDHGPLAA
jgi:hypothetical protein